MTTDFALSLRLYNNQIRSRRRRLGLSQRELADLAGISYSNANAYENLRAVPFTKRGWRASAKKLAATLGAEPEDLWPDSVLSVKESRAELELTAEQAAALAGGSVEALEARTPELLLAERETKQGVRSVLLELLDERQRQVLAGLYADGRSAAELARELGLSRQGVLHVQSAALRRLRRLKLRELQEVADGAEPTAVYQKGQPRGTEAGAVVANRTVAELRRGVRPAEGYPSWEDAARTYGLPPYDEAAKRSYLDCLLAHTERRLVAGAEIEPLFSDEAAKRLWDARRALG